MRVPSRILSRFVARETNYSDPAPAFGIVKKLNNHYNFRHVSTMKRKLDQKSVPEPKSKELPYHLTPSITDEDGDIIWPAPKEQMKLARDIIVAW